MSAEEFYNKESNKYDGKSVQIKTVCIELMEAYADQEKVKYHKAELEKVKCERTRHNEDIFNHGYCLKCESKLKQ